jgi:demethylmenaquinone methyltransferase/2-methoxy-6-polyprenyl-1,4-benzoquinol methylase
VTLLRWPSDPREAVRRGIRQFDRVAPRYDLFRALLSFGLETRWKRRSLAVAVPGEAARCLDIATGTGEIAELLHARAPGAQVVGVDGNAAMLTRARRRRVGPRARWVLADLNRLPLAAGTFDVVTLAYGLRYAVDRPAFFAACREALRADGVLWCFDLGRPRWLLVRAIWFAYLLAAGTLLGLVLHGRPATYWHLVETLRAYPGQGRVVDELAGAGFREVRCEDLLGGMLAVHAARR